MYCKYLIVQPLIGAENAAKKANKEENEGAHEEKRFMEMECNEDLPAATFATEAIGKAKQNASVFAGILDKHDMHVKMMVDGECQTIAAIAFRGCQYCIVLHPKS